MKRLTKWNNKLGRYVANNDTGTSTQRNHLLGQYEDTGLTPEQVQELIERDTAKPVTEICGACGEKYECPNCGSGLRDTDVFAGHCKWCGQKIKLEDDNGQI